MPVMYGVNFTAGCYQYCGKGCLGHSIHGVKKYFQVGSFYSLNVYQRKNGIYILIKRVNYTDNALLDTFIKINLFYIARVNSLNFSSISEVTFSLASLPPDVNTLMPL